MSLKVIASIIVLAGAATACQAVPKDMSVVQYCADAKNATKDVCKVNVEIDGQKRALAQTNMSLSEARAIADNAMKNAATAQQTAEAAQRTADEAKTLAMTDKPLNCATKTVARSKSASCEPGFKLISCVQTHYTSKRGGTSIMRKIDDNECVFQDKVLEIQARCCMVGGEPMATPTAAPAQPTVKPQPNPAS